MSEEFKDHDVEETREWIDSFDAVLDIEGPEKAKYLIHKLSDQAVSRNVPIPYSSTTPYTNTIPPEESEQMPDDSLTARNVAGYVRWNAMAMVHRANKHFPGIGGHIASFSSSAVLYEVGFDYFFKGNDFPGGGDLIFFQGHSSPGMYARAYVEGRLTDDDLDHFRREAFEKGLSSYPHPWLMPDFWQFPTVSMGLGPVMAIYQARFMKYMEARGLTEKSERKVWAFIGDGETDEPETRGSISLAVREKLDNLIFVINCNLQRLDGPVRGNGKIIQELEGVFRGAGWNVIKVIWGTEWEDILKKDEDGVLKDIFEKMVDGEFQDLRSKDAAHLRKRLIEKDGRVEKILEPYSDQEIWQATRGGHDPRKVYAAYAEAVKTRGRPTLILTKTIKGYGMGASGESANVAHNTKKMEIESLKEFRDRFHVPLEDDRLEEVPFIRPPKDSDEYRFIHDWRKKLGGYLPERRHEAEPLNIPPLENFSKLLEGTGDKEMSTTMGFVRFLAILLKDKKIGKNVVPIVPDEARTFGMEGLFRQVGIYAPGGQLYTPEDSNSLMSYMEKEGGQILEEGINEAGAISSFIAAGTAYSNYGVNCIPFYIFYSMFGFQRVGDLAWAAGDIRTRGFLLGATSGRTTLNGEGLQHEDGHSHLIASSIPNCRSYDPAFVYELVVLLRHGMKEMFEDRNDVFYYITLLNEKYENPKMPEGCEEGIVKGMYLFKEAGEFGTKVQLMGSGSIFREVIAAARLLEDDFGIGANIWSIPGINQLHRDGVECERYNMFHPDGEERVPYVTRILADREGPAVISTDYLRAYPEQIRRLVPMPLTVLGTDGFGRSDTREALRDFFEVDRYHIVLAALAALRKAGKVDAAIVKKAIDTYNIKTDRPNPMSV
ncbi:MAG: pyruvate dehydrogenase (acetyl-transferring), homodimeric type [Spirochaetota bacterium]